MLPTTAANRCAMSEARPTSGPTNGRPWPGDRVRLKLSGREGIVEDYEYGWNSNVFPVRFPADSRMCGTRSAQNSDSRMCSISSVEIIESTIQVLPLHPNQTATPRPTTQATAAAKARKGAA